MVHSADRFAILINAGRANHEPGQVGRAWRIRDHGQAKQCLCIEYRYDHSGDQSSQGDASEPEEDVLISACHGYQLPKG